jgi:hypothetical protein
VAEEEDDLRLLFPTIAEAFVVAIRIDEHVVSELCYVKGHWLGFRGGDEVQTASVG